MHSCLCSVAYAQLLVHSCLCTVAYAQLLMHSCLCTVAYAQLLMLSCLCTVACAQSQYASLNLVVLHILEECLVLGYSKLWKLLPSPFHFVSSLTLIRSILKTRFLLLVTVA